MKDENISVTSDRQTSPESISPVANPEEEDQPQEIVIDRAELQRVMTKLTKAIEDGIKDGIKRGLLHLPASDRFLLMVASDLVQKSQKFPSYKITFYHQGMGEGTDTCAVTFIEE